ncbi:hypothetical protein GJ496_005165 [Pomphorhynchus laevis]|nr:hypothetical protein GJ496_005165 [Pomphorhynchus laevis]
MKKKFKLKGLNDNLLNKIIQKGSMTLKRQDTSEHDSQIDNEPIISECTSADENLDTLQLIDNTNDTIDTPSINGSQQNVDRSLLTAESSNNSSNQQFDENFNRIMLASDILDKAKVLDDEGQYYDALFFYRQGVDVLLDELFSVDGTSESRDYLQAKCTHFMDRIDELKAHIYKDDPIICLNDLNSSVFTPTKYFGPFADIIDCLEYILDTVSNDCNDRSSF